MSSIAQLPVITVPTTKIYNRKMFHLFQLLSHRVHADPEPIEIKATNLISDKIYMKQVNWVITSLKDGLTLQRPNFEGETVYYTEDQVIENIDKFTPKTTPDQTPIFSY